MIVVLMGVSGSGKTFIGNLLAQRAGGVFADGDDYHPKANKEKMAAGHPLDDRDRQPWLETLNQLLKGWAATGTSGVLACSALKEQYRQRLAAGLPTGTMDFCYLEVSEAVLQERLAERKHEFMNPKLLQSQLATLEAPRDAIVVKNDRAAEVVVEEILRKVRGQEGAAHPTG